MPSTLDRGRWMALTAALLGWMFDGLEMGLFPLVAGPALNNLLENPTKEQIDLWLSIATAAFLIGAATGGVLFGWLGDRIGRVRAMTLSVLTYALFTGACGLVNSAALIAVLRFISALGMGGEWSLGVALVMEVWPGGSRAWLAGLIGAAANVGYLLMGFVGWQLLGTLSHIGSLLSHMGVSDETILYFVDPKFSGWRILMLLGATPALLTFFIRLMVPESHRWEEERSKGATSSWAAADLLGVLIGGLAACLIIFFQAAPAEFPRPDQVVLHLSPEIRVAGSLLAFVIALSGFLFPVVRYLQRSAEKGRMPDGTTWGIVRRLLLAACLSGIPLLGTWASIQRAPTWAYTLAGKSSEAASMTQIASAAGAIFGTIIAALAGDWLGRRLTYALLCIGSFVASLAFFQLNDVYSTKFLWLAFIAGGTTASFYGWLPLYLPELFRTGVRATGQGFSFNFGRILAAVGALQTANLMSLFGGSYPKACSIMSCIYFVGFILIWFAPETKGKPLPE